MPRARSRDPIYRQRRFPAEIIETCVSWYSTYPLSYRDLVDMMAERGITVSHTTIMRWVLRYVPEYEARWGRYARPVHILGGWTRPLSECVADIITCTEPWISMGSRWIPSFVRVGTGRLRRRFSSTQ